MHHHADGPGWLATVNTLANLAIVAGYLTIPFTVLARLPVTGFVRVSGAFFFLCCALTHIAMAIEGHPSWWLTTNHVVQSVAVWCFVLGFARLVRAANARSAGKCRKDRP